MSTSYGQKMICNKNDGAPEQQDKQPLSNNIDVTDAISEGIDSVALLDNNSDISEVPKEMCASCGKGEEDSNKLKTCTACLSVKYCSRDCQKAHRQQHKKACKKRAAELFDEKLFKEVEREECPICMLPMPLDGSDIFESCCGKMICSGCIYAMNKSEGKGLCAFCRSPPTKSHEEDIKRTKELMDKGNGGAFHQLAGGYARGMYGLPQDQDKANELLLKAGELGYTKGYYNLGNSYNIGNGVQVDKKKAKYYWELAAMGGNIKARHNLGVVEAAAGNNERAMKHFVMAAKAGDMLTLDNVKIGFMNGYITKDEYANTLRAYYERQQEMKSDTRDKGAKVVAKMRHS